MSRRLLPPLLAIATAAGVLLAMPGTADAAPNPCRPGFVLAGVLCAPDPSAALPPAAAPAAPAQPAPAPQRSLLDRLLGRNRPAPAPAPAPAPVAPPRPPAPAQAAPAPPPPPAPPAPQAQQPPVLPVIILPAPAVPGPLPSERTVWLHTCVDLYVADAHLLELDNQALDVPPLAYVIFQCAANPGVIPLIPVTPGAPPSAGSQTVYTHLPVTG